MDKHGQTVNPGVCWSFTVEKHVSIISTVNSAADL